MTTHPDAPMGLAEPDPTCSPLDCATCGILTCRDREAPMLVAPRISPMAACDDPGCELCFDQCKRPSSMLVEARR